MEQSLGKVTISAVRCSDAVDYVSIKIANWDGQRLVVAEMDFSEFAKAITGSGDMKGIIKDYRKK